MYIIQLILPDTNYSKRLFLFQKEIEHKNQQKKVTLQTIR